MKTPYYEIDEERLDADIGLLQSALQKNWGENSIYACSVKTNSLPWLLVHFRDRGAWAEVVSAEEYALVMQLGFDPARVIYNGPIKERSVFEKVLRDGDLSIWIPRRSWSGWRKRTGNSAGTWDSGSM